MASTSPEGARGWSAWREVGAAWAVAVVLAGALVLTVPRRDGQNLVPSLWSLSPVAGGHVHQRTTDDEGPIGDQACSDRDYVNERC